MPVQWISTTAPVKPFVPDSEDLFGKLRDTAKIRRAFVVLVMAPKLAVDSVLLLVNWIMPMFPAPDDHSLQTAP